MIEDIFKIFSIEELKPIAFFYCFLLGLFIFIGIRFIIDEIKKIKRG